MAENVCKYPAATQRKNEYRKVIGSQVAFPFRCVCFLLFVQGKVVFHDPKEIMVDGQATKQITLTSTGEVRVAHTHTLSLSHTHLNWRGKSGTHTLSLSHTLTSTGEVRVAHTHTLSLSHTLTSTGEVRVAHTHSLSLSHTHLNWRGKSGTQHTLSL